MKKSVLLLLTIVILSACQERQENTIAALNGYWEIEKVILPNTHEKEYKFNQNIDFFELNDTIGRRKKVQPRLDGSFSTTNSFENFILKKEGDSLRLLYKTSLASWEEKIITVNKNILILENNQGIRYQYKPYKRLEL